MSQGGSLIDNDSGGIIQTIAGDSGSITGANVTIYANNTAKNAGSSVKFVNSGTTSTFNVTDSNNNLMIGKGSGNSSISGSTNVSLGVNATQSLTSGNQNVSIGTLSAQNLTTGAMNVSVGTNTLNANSTGDYNTSCGGFALNASTGSSNTALGYSALPVLVGGNSNIAISNGKNAGGNYTSTESSNIVIGNEGVLGESHVIRLGTSGSNDSQQNTCYVAGITGVTAVGSPAAVSSTGQLSDLGFGTSTQVLTSNGAGVSPTWQAIPMHAATAFRAYLNANTAANITGDGTLVTVHFDTVDYDTDSGYNTGTYTYTVPVGKTGVWQINYTVFAYRTAGTNTVIILNVLKNATTIRNYEMNFENTQTSGELTLTSGIQAKLTAGDTVKVQCNVAGNASKNIGFAGTYCVFSGNFLGSA